MISSDPALEVQLDNLLNEDMSSLLRRERSLFDELASPFNDSIVIFGAGNLGRKTVAGLRKVGIEPLAFADNNKSLWNAEVDGIKVFSPIDAARLFGNRAVFVVAVWSPGSDRRIPYITRCLTKLACEKVVSFVPLFWKYPELFLPHFRLDSPNKALRQADDVRKTFSLWADEDSRREYLAQLKWILSLDFGELPPAALHETYLPDDIFTWSQEEVFIDCGAFDGDTIKNFLRHQEDSFGGIVAFEPDPVNFDRLREYVSTLHGMNEKIALWQLAAGARKEKLRFEALGSVSSSVSGSGSLEVECVSLDEVLDGCVPTYIKMDIEGAEPDALKGARGIIDSHLPVLAICVYHRQDHLWSLPLLINSLSHCRYRFFLRRYVDEFGDVVCYAVPESRLTNKL